jgi:multicomponent Na+:H+ antiporter subunit G
MDMVSWGLILCGCGFAIVGGIGVVRLPDFYTRLHASGVTDTLGAGLLIVGLMVHSARTGYWLMCHEGISAVIGPSLIAVKLAMILFFLLITSPTACHALAQAALSLELQPQLADQDEKAAEQ